MLKDRAFLVQMIKTPNPNASNVNVNRLRLTAPQVKQIAIHVGAVYTYVVVLHTIRDIALLAAKTKFK